MKKHGKMKNIMKHLAENLLEQIGYVIEPEYPFLTHDH